MAPVLTELKALRELLFPVHCFGCNKLGIEVCSQCRKNWHPHFYRQNFGDLEVYSSIRYSSTAKSILLSAKEDSVRLADELIIDALHNCLRRLPSSILRHAVLLPIPGSKRANRKRGRDFILEITKQLSIRSGVPILTGLKINRTLLDQSRLNAADRSRNISGAFVFKAKLSESFEQGGSGDFKDLNREILLVDDLVTSGATLLEAKRAIFASGIRANRAITACVAQTLNIGR